MIISFTRNPRCIQCKRPDRGRLRAAVVIRPVGWLGFKFRLCQQCADEMVARAEANPKIRRVDG